VEKLRVVYIADIGVAGGATKSLLELVCTIRDEQEVIPIVFTARLTEFNKRLNELSIENYALGYGAFMQNSPESAWKKPIKWIIRYFEYKSAFFASQSKALKCIDWNLIDIVHTNVARIDIGMELCRKTGKLCVCHLREFGELDFGCWSYRREYIDYLSNYSNRFLAVSEAVKDYWIKKGIPADRVSVIYNGVRNENIICAKHESWIDDIVIRIVIVGNFIRNKGQYQAVDAVCSLPIAIRKNVKLDIVGGVKQSIRKRIQKAFARAGVENNIGFVGHSDEVYKLLQRYHVGLMCSKMEAFGRVTVEYMHAGLAVIATNSGANPELIENGVDGLLYDGSVTSELAKNITKLYHDRQLMIRIAENGYKKASARYTSHLNAAGVRKEYDDLLK